MPFTPVFQAFERAIALDDKVLLRQRHFILVQPFADAIASFVTLLLGVFIFRFEYRNFLVQVADMLSD
mgnify:CR=1 FL=1